MPQYMILIKESPSADRHVAASQTKALLEAQAAYIEQLRAVGAFRDGERLRPSGEGCRVDATGVQAAPFADEAAVGGYFLVEAESLAAAVKLAAPVPLAVGETQEVRPVMRGKVRAEKDEAPGKVFAFAVLGKASSEEAWVNLMDRIEADTHQGFPDKRFLGGVRLKAPSLGRQLLGAAEKQMVMDGPFLESKEIIGGLFFMRLADLGEAVAWARGTRFMKYGGLEIRELWRS